MSNETERDIRDELAGLGERDFLFRKAEIIRTHERQAAKQRYREEMKRDAGSPSLDALLEENERRGNG